MRKDCESSVYSATGNWQDSMARKLRIHKAETSTVRPGPGIGEGRDHQDTWERELGPLLPQPTQKRQRKGRREQVSASEVATTPKTATGRNSQITKNLCYATLFSLPVAENGISRHHCGQHTALPKHVSPRVHWTLARYRGAIGSRKATETPENPHAPCHWLGNAQSHSASGVLHPDQRPHPSSPGGFRKRSQVLTSPTLNCPS